MGLLKKRKRKDEAPGAPESAAPETALSDVLARVETLTAKLEVREDPLAASADRLIAAGGRLAGLLDVAGARHPELGPESVLEASGLTSGTHYAKTDTGHTLRLPGGRDCRICTVPVGRLADEGDADGFAGVVREMFGDAEALLFPEYALAGLLSSHPDMVAEAAKSSTVLATPSTMLAMLAWAGAEWRYADRVGEIGKAGGRMAKAVRAFAARYAELGKRLGGARQMYNSGLGPWGDVERTVGLAAEAVGTSLDKPEKIGEWCFFHAGHISAGHFFGCGGSAPPRACSSPPWPAPVRSSKRLPFAGSFLC